MVMADRHVHFYDVSALWLLGHTSVNCRDQVLLQALAHFDKVIDVLISLDARWQLGLEKSPEVFLRLLLTLLKKLDLLADIPATASDREYFLPGCLHRAPKCLIPFLQFKLVRGVEMHFELAGIDDQGVAILTFTFTHVFYYNV
jgi:hypothetical protein